MRAAGVELIAHVGQMAVMGFIEPIKRLPKYRALLQQLTERIRSGSVALVVLIDHAAFNMRVAAVAAAAGVPVLYYITPQVWASRAKRLERLAQTVTKAAVILPFEEPLLRKHGIDATFVGHPLLDRLASVPDRAEARRRLGIRANDRVLALFPGSRRAGDQSASRRRSSQPRASCSGEFRRSRSSSASRRTSRSIRRAVRSTMVRSESFAHASRGRRGAVQERHDDARGGGGRVPARRGVSCTGARLRRGQVAGQDSSYWFGEYRRRQTGGAGVHPGRAAAGGRGEHARAAAESRQRRAS